MSVLDKWRLFLSNGFISVHECDRVDRQKKKHMLVIAYVAIGGIKIK